MRGRWANSPAAALFGGHGAIANLPFERAPSVLGGETSERASGIEKVGDDGVHALPFTPAIRHRRRPTSR
jgi:hypothetical protein